MNNPSETNKLAEAVARIATTITEVIDSRLRTNCEESNDSSGERNLQSTERVAALEGWVKKRDVAVHFNVSVRTVDNWMRMHLLPYIKLRKSVRFKLSEADEALNRGHKRQSRW